MPTPEDKARENIDRLLTQAGWAVRDQSGANNLAYGGVAVSKFYFETGSRLCRLIPYVDRRAQVDALNKLQSETAAELDALLPSILDKAFRGQV